MMKKINTTFILIISVITTIMAVALFIFFLKVIKNKNEHIATVTTTLEEKMKEKENAILFADKVSEIKILEETINSHFLDRNQIDKFVDYLEQVGSALRSEVRVENIEPSTPGENMVTVSVLIKGTFDQVVRTINYLENIPYEVNINQVYLNKDVSPATQDTSQSRSIQGWQANVSFNILSGK